MLCNVQIIALLFPPVSKVHAGSFHVSIIHWILTWTTGSLTCVHDYSHAYMYIRGLRHRLRVSTFLTRKNCHKFFLVLCVRQAEFEPLTTWIFGSWIRCSTNWATPFLLYIYFDKTSFILHTAGSRLLFHVSFSHIEISIIYCYILSLGVWLVDGTMPSHSFFVKLFKFNFVWKAIYLSIC